MTNIKLNPKILDQELKHKKESISRSIKLYKFFNILSLIESRGKIFRQLRIGKQTKEKGIETILFRNFFFEFLVEPRIFTFLRFVLVLAYQLLK